MSKGFVVGFGTGTRVFLRRDSMAYSNIEIYANWGISVQTPLIERVLKSSPKARQNRTFVVLLIKHCKGGPACYFNQTTGWAPNSDRWPPMISSTEIGSPTKFGLFGTRALICMAPAISPGAAPA